MIGEYRHIADDSILLRHLSATTSTKTGSSETLNYVEHKEISDEVYGAEWKVYYDVNYIIKGITRDANVGTVRGEARRERASTSNNITATKFVIRSGQKQKIEYASACIVRAKAEILLPNYTSKDGGFSRHGCNVDGNGGCELRNSALRKFRGEVSTRSRVSRERRDLYFDSRSSPFFPHRNFAIFPDAA